MYGFMMPWNCWTGPSNRLQIYMSQLPNWQISKWYDCLINQPLAFVSIKFHVHGLFDTDLHEVSWQPTRPLSLVGSKFIWQSADQCQRTHSKWVFVFVPHLQSKHSHLILSKWPPKSSSTITMTAHSFVALAQVHRIGWECDLVWPD